MCVPVPISFTKISASALLSHTHLHFITGSSYHCILFYFNPVIYPSLCPLFNSKILSPYHSYVHTYLIEHTPLAKSIHVLSSPNYSLHYSLSTLIYIFISLWLLPQFFHSPSAMKSCLLKALYYFIIQFTLYKLLSWYHQSTVPIIHPAYMYTIDILNLSILFLLFDLSINAVSSHTHESIVPPLYFLFHPFLYTIIYPCCLYWKRGENIGLEKNLSA